jgi:hypothetical protein
MRHVALLAVRRRGVAVHKLNVKSEFFKPGYLIQGSRVKIRCFQHMGQLDSTGTQPHRERQPRLGVIRREARHLRDLRTAGARVHTTNNGTDWTKTKQSRTSLVHDTGLTNERHAKRHANPPRLARDSSVASDGSAACTARSASSTREGKPPFLPPPPPPPLFCEAVA